MAQGQLFTGCERRPLPGGHNGHDADTPTSPFDRNRTWRLCCSVKLSQTTPRREDDGNSFLSFEFRPDHLGKSLQRGLRHVVAAGEVMSREQEHVLNTCFLPRLQEALCTTLWWAEKSKRIGNLARL